MDAASVALAPLLPWTVLGPLFGLAVLALLVGAWRRAPGLGWRTLAFLALAAALLNPSLVEEKRDPIRDVAVVVVDRSPSDQIEDRPARIDAALADLRTKLAAFPDLETRFVTVGENANAPLDETHLFEALGAATADVPRRRLAGAILVTDGQVHDVPTDPAVRSSFGPVHTLLTGRPDEFDRRIVVAQAPSFGLVGQDVTVTLRVDDLPNAEPGAVATVTATKDAGAPEALQLPVGRDTQVSFRLDHGGPTVFEFAVEGLPGELSQANNRAAIVVNGVRDRLRVLLVSGEPHPGERTWRNILKSDPSVDLVHFTILRPPEKQDGTPINELSLISFPIRELFETNLKDFDLIIFDRYRRMGVLPNLYLGNIARYVEEGGAFLEVSGEAFAEPLSLYRTPIGNILPAEPTGEVLEQGFRPTVTELGQRHPVTATLEGSTGGPGGGPSWGRWFRQIDVVPHGGNVVMTGAGGRPLLILNRVGEGRVAQMASDQIWLWSRGFEGGGPQAELLRRLAHWLMREPELEENVLRAEAAGQRIEIRRRNLDQSNPPITVTDPDGKTQSVTLSETTPGLYAGRANAQGPGIYRVSDGDKTALAVVGTLNPPELSDMRAVTDKLAPVTQASGGGVAWLVTDGVPTLRRTRPDRAAAGAGWFGLRGNGDYTVTGMTETPLLPPLIALFLGLGGLMAAWRREGR